MKAWNILYRGSLSSCNYECGYCPFAKTSNTRAELLKDERELRRFVDWVAEQPNEIGILFTPWGEALIHSYYRREIVRLSHLPNVKRVAIQTNLSASIGELIEANRSTLSLWTTFHPSQSSLPRFISNCRELDEARIRYSVGVVGLKEHFEAIQLLRAQLRPEVYLWVNAFKRESDYYTSQEIDGILSVDPYFDWNLRQYASAEKACLGGETTFTVDSDGNIRRCHFIKDIIGNIYDPNFRDTLKPRVCSSAICNCHIGYVHRPELRLNELYGKGLLERIPQNWPMVNREFANVR